MRVIIIGAGISGCTAYLSLQKHLPQPTGSTKHQITIYEAYDTNLNTTASTRNDPASSGTHSSTLVVGGGLGLFANGFNVLRRLDGDIARDIVRDGYAIAHQDLRSKNGTLLVRMDCCADLDAESEEGGTRNKKGVHLLGTSRHSLWTSLRRRIPDEDIQTVRVSRVIARQDGRNEVHFADGREPVEADLIIGADGIKGVTKEALFPGEEGLYKPEYQGLVGVGGFISSEEVKDLVKKGSMNLLLGGNGFFGYFYSTSATSSSSRDSIYQASEPGSHLGWWSTYAVDECPDPRTIDVDAVTNQLRERHAHWKDPTVQKILGSLRVKNMYPTWTSPQLPTWERNGIVLVGDAAHALPSTSGQGSSQALEDVEAFTLLLSNTLRDVYQKGSPDVMAHKDATSTAAKQYMEIRRPRVQGILEAAQRMQNSKRGMGVIAEYMMYCAMWIAGCFPGIMSRSVKSVINYDISEEVKAFIEREKR
ncbi:hypothetical protein BDV06DRAFT_141562 [Aspergillus oleicola]